MINIKYIRISYYDFLILCCVKPELMQDLFFIYFYFSYNSCAYPKYMAIGLNLYLRSQSIYFVGFGFSIVGGPMLGKPKYTSIYSSLPLFLTESLFCSL